MKQGRFTTFGGVFTPCTLTILGVIMFLRFGQVMGQAGLWHGLAIVLCAKAITTLTSLSLSAIATNTRVKGGGAYFLISRSLGVEFGGAIGVVFYLAQAISVALYVVGFTEALVGLLPALEPHAAWIATGVNVATFACVYVGAGWAIKTQYAILAVLGAAIASFAIGAVLDFDAATLTANLGSSYLPGESFTTMFALFFPAVTGIMAGANMSGDLADPARSIPRGTIAAVAATAVVYLGQAVLLAGSAPREVLIGDNLVVQHGAIVPALVVAGIFAATLSSAIGSMMGAPRILQAFARDDVFPGLRAFAKGSGRHLEPRRAIVATFVVAQAAVLAGDLDVIAPVITMFFMLTYGTLNLATFYETIAKNPSYRPTFRFSTWATSLAGAIGCLGAMLLLDPLWAGVSILTMVGLHWCIGWREIGSRWGDVHSGLLIERTRKNLLQLEQELYHPKNWRPIVLALSGHGWSRPHLALFGHWLTAGHGILTLAHVVVGEVGDHAERQADYEKALRRFIAKEELAAFPVALVANDLSSGIESLVQCHGLGGLRPNTVLMGWPSDPSRIQPFGATLRLIAQMRRSIIVARYDNALASDGGDDDDAWEVPHGTIDVWWRGMRNGELMLLLAHLLRQNSEWRRCKIRILRVVPNEAAREDVRAHLATLCEFSRISAEPVVVVDEDVPRAIAIESGEASVVVLGFQPPEEGQEERFLVSMSMLVGTLPRVLLVCSGGGMLLES